MTITVVGPDDARHEFPDDTSPEVVKGVMARHYGEPAAAPAASGDDVSALAAGRGIPILGALSDKAAAGLRTLTRGGSVAKNQADISRDVDAYEQAHPIESAIGKTAIGTAALAPAGLYAPAARALGMTGTLPQMTRNAALSSGIIGGADEAARGGGAGDIAKSAVINAGAGAILPGAGRLVGMGARGIRNLVAPPPRIPRTVDINGNPISIPESYVNPTNEVGSQEQAAKAGALGVEPQQIAQGAHEQTLADTEAAAQNFGNEMRGGPGPAPPTGPADKSTAAGQTITELAQQHNDQIQAQARQDAAEASRAAQIGAEGASLRGDVRAPLGAPEAPPSTSRDAMEATQQALQAREQASRNNYNRLYTEAGQTPGEYHPAAFSQVGQSVRNQIDQGARARGVQPAIVNEGLTPNAHAALDLLDNQLGQNYVENSMRRGDMVRLPDGRVVPRPLTPADVESVRKQLVGLLSDARAVQARGGSGNDAYAMQQILDAFDRHHNAVLSTPGAFSGDAAAYRQSIDAARAAFSQHKDTFANQRRGDNVGPTIEKILGAHNAEPMPAEPMANAVYGSASSPGSGNSPLIARHLVDVFGAGSPEVRNLRQGMISHILENPDGTPLEAIKQASRLAKYAGSQHAEALFTPQERTRMMAHANDLRDQANYSPAKPAERTTVQKTVDKLGAEGSPQHVIDKIFSSNGDIKAGSGAILSELKQRVSQQNWNQIRQAMWEHLRDKGEGLVDWGPRELSNRLARFLKSEAAPVLYNEHELGVMRQFQQHWDKLAPLANTTNPSGSAVMASKLARGMGRHIFGMLGFSTGGLHGAAFGAAADEVANAIKTQRQIEKTKELFLGKRNRGEVSKNYERAASVLSHAATPLINGNGP